MSNMPVYFKEVLDNNGTSMLIGVFIRGRLASTYVVSVSQSRN